MASLVDIQGTLGTDTSDATATAAQVFSGYTAYAKGSKLVGTGKGLPSVTSGEFLLYGLVLGGGTITQSIDDDYVYATESLRRRIYLAKSIDLSNISQIVVNMSYSCSRPASSTNICIEAWSSSGRTAVDQKDSNSNTVSGTLTLNIGSNFTTNCVLSTEFSFWGGEWGRTSHTFTYTFNSFRTRDNKVHTASNPNF